MRTAFISMFNLVCSLAPRVTGTGDPQMDLETFYSRY